MIEGRSTIIPIGKRRWLIGCIFALVVFGGTDTATYADCRTPDGSYGYCTRLQECGPMVNLLALPSPAALAFLRKSICGYQGFEPKVTNSIYFCVQNAYQKCFDVYWKIRRRFEIVLDSLSFCGVVSILCITDFLIKLNYLLNLLNLECVTIL